MGQVFLRRELNSVQIANDFYMQAATQFNNSGNSPAYSYQVWLNSDGNKPRRPDLPADAYAFTGDRVQVVMIVPSRDAVLLRMGWSARYCPRNERGYAPPAMAS